MTSEEKRLRLQHAATDFTEADQAKEYWSTTEFQSRTFSRILPMNARMLLNIAASLQPDSVFEFGCNAGRNLGLLRDRAVPAPSRVQGCDINKESVAYGKEEYGLDLHVGDETFLASLDSDAFDLVFTVSVLDHMPNYPDALVELARIARKHLLLFEPTRIDPSQESSKAEAFENDSPGMWEDATPFSYFHPYHVAALLLGLRTRTHLPTPLRRFRLGPYYEIHLYEKVQGETCLADRIRRMASDQGTSLSFPSCRYPDLARLLEKDAPEARTNGQTAVRFALDPRDAEAFDAEAATSDAAGLMLICDRTLVPRILEAGKRMGTSLVPVHGAGEVVLLTDLEDIPGKTDPLADPAALRSAFDQIRESRQLARSYGLSFLDWNHESLEAARRARAKVEATDRSLKYRIGEAIIRAARPSRDTILLPARLWRLYREAKGKSNTATETKKRRRKRYRTAQSEIRGLFFATNGVGLGHLTRSLAIARRLRDLEPTAELTFITTCHATHLVEEQGFDVYHVPSVRDYDGLMTLQEWNKQLRNQLRRVLDRSEAHFLVFDGAQPYDGLADVLRAERKVLTRVWVKRGQLKAALEEMRQHKMRLFDLVIEPGEVGGPDPEAKDETARWVAPITLLGEDDLLSREAAASHLGIDPSRRAVLLLLGAGNINDTESLTHQAIDVAQELDAQVVVAESPIAKARAEAPEGVVIAKEYPISRLFRAFDLTVAAAGYNTVAELCRFDVPSILIPNEHTGADDQVARAMAAAALGSARVLRPFSREGLERIMRASFQSAGGSPNRPSAGMTDGAMQAAEQIRRMVRTPDA